MKHIYIKPATLTVQLGTCHMMAESFRIFGSTGESAQTIEDESQILTKEITDVNVWDEEW